MKQTGSTTLRRSSSGVGRVLAILDFFANHANQSFMPADLTRALKLHRSTCHSLLGEMLAAGYLYRTRDGAYLIGPRLLAAGRIAKDDFSLQQIVEPEMRELADEFDTICAALWLDGDATIVRSRATSVSQLGLPLPLGLRVPLRPPAAAAIFAWSPPEQFEAWFDALQPAAEPGQRDNMIAAMAFAREHGYGFGCRSTLLSAESWREYQPPVSNYPITAEVALDPQREYALAYVDSPIFNMQGRVISTLAFTQPRGTYTGVQVAAMGCALREASGRISVFARLSNWR